MLRILLALVLAAVFLAAASAESKTEGIARFCFLLYTGTGVCSLCIIYATYSFPRAMDMPPHCSPPLRRVRGLTLSQSLTPFLNEPPLPATTAGTTSITATGGHAGSDNKNTKQKSLKPVLLLATVEMMAAALQQPAGLLPVAATLLLLPVVASILLPPALVVHEQPAKPVGSVGNVTAAAVVTAAAAPAWLPPGKGGGGIEAPFSGRIDERAAGLGTSAAAVGAAADATVADNRLTHTRNLLASADASITDFAAGAVTVTPATSEVDTSGTLTIMAPMADTVSKGLRDLLVASLHSHQFDIPCPTCLFKAFPERGRNPCMHPFLGTIDAIACSVIQAVMSFPQ